jgi:uncharacterized spore protein YtfJ
MTEKDTLSIEEIQPTDPGQAVDMVQETLETFMDSADVRRAYGEPHEKDGTIIIPAAEVLVGMGFGVAYGSGPKREDGDAQGGSGGGGGGRTLSRPVAVIIASPEGVRVEPVIDVTKIIMAFFTAFGFIVSTLFRMKRGK